MVNGKSVFIPASTHCAAMASSRDGVMAYFCKPNADLYAELST
ncbi:hypothetical protein [Pseudomonas sp. HMWF021]|jgi:hypothetical protein|nr:hypothetical protein [Pseudomonas sp. HMWF021]